MKHRARAMPLSLLLASVPLHGEIKDVLKSGEIDRLFTNAEQSIQVHATPAYDIWLQALTKPTGFKANSQADEMVFVHGGRGTAVLGDRHYEVGAGDVIHIPRGTQYRIDPRTNRLERIVVTVRPSGEDLPPRTGFLAPRQMPEVLKNTDIESTFARYDTNQPIHSGRNYTMNYVIYAGHSGPWEAHRNCVDIYFVRVGTAAAQLGGQIENAKEESPGEIRGTGVQGARSYQIGLGDIVLIPRNTAHHMTPNGPKLGYLLMKIWVE